MQSNTLPLFKTKNGNYISPSISKKALEEMCKESFKIVIAKNKKKENEFSPDYVIFVIGDS